MECAGLKPRLCVFQATDKRKALEETMAFTTQALASVAYQVGNLAGHTLRMLDLQGAALRQVEAKISTLSQVRVWGGVPFQPSLVSLVPLKYSLQEFLAFLHVHRMLAPSEPWRPPSWLCLSVVLDTPLSAKFSESSLSLSPWISRSFVCRSQYLQRSGETKGHSVIGI